MASVEQVPADEDQQIAEIVRLTIAQLRHRYPGGKPVLRGVHPKDHGCVKAVFRVLSDLKPEFQHGVFSKPGNTYESWLRFSNAAVVVDEDTTPATPTSPVKHGSRGMAVKLLGVSGKPLLEPHGFATQDFLMVNQPVFAFANVEDYLVLSQELVKNNDNAAGFFPTQFAKGGEAALRAKRTGGIVARIQAEKVDGVIGAFQQPPASPIENTYFSASPFMFGDAHVMKFRAVPVDAPSGKALNIADPNYLRNALIKRLSTPEAGPIQFNFQIQKRPIDGVNPAVDIEDASVEWSENDHPFETVATISIPLQYFDSPEHRATCERLFFSPWHGIEEHRPLGGINRLRLTVYEASVKHRQHAKELNRSVPNG